MATTKQDIKEWLDRGEKEQAKYMIVACDTFDYDDYPIYCHTVEEFWKKYDDHNGKNMQTIMEVYDLSLNIENQLNESRSRHMPERK